MLTVVTGSVVVGALLMTWASWIQKRLHQRTLLKTANQLKLAGEDRRRWLEGHTEEVLERLQQQKEEEVRREEEVLRAITVAAETETALGSMDDLEIRFHLWADDNEVVARGLAHLMEWPGGVLTCEDGQYVMRFENELDARSFRFVLLFGVEYNPENWQEQP